MMNPGYQPPQGIRLFLSNGVVLTPTAEFLDVIMDRGVPTPRFALVFAGDMQLANVTVSHMEVDVYPPGTIICFPQRGPAVENAERILARSRRLADMRKIGHTRRIDPDGRITPT